MIDFLVAVLRSGTPLIYVTMAGMMAQRAGVWHLGLEGLMIVGACASVLGAASSGSVAFGLLAAIVACVALSVLFWFVVDRLKANAIIAGLGLTGLGLAGTDLAVQAVYGSQGAVRSALSLPRMTIVAGLPSLSVLVLAMPLVVFGLWLLLRRTRFGLRLAAVGEHPFAARSVGADPSRMRLIALAGGGVLCALGGAELALGNLQVFSINMTAGRGYMAFSAAAFGGGHPVYAACAATFFAAVDTLGIRAQLIFGDIVPRHVLLILPYVVTVLVIWLSARMDGRRAAAQTMELRDI